MIYRKQKSLKRFVIDFSELLFGKRFTDELAVKYFKRNWIFDRDVVTNFHIKQCEQNITITNSNYAKEVFNIFYRTLPPDQLVPAHTLSRAESFVPFYPGKTNLLLYNFFSRNYGIRDPILFRCIALRDRVPLAIKNLLFCADQIYLLNNLFENCWYENGKCDSKYVLVIQAFHPRIKTPSNQLRYFAIYHDKDSMTVAGTHSIQLPTRDVELSYKPSLRSFAPTDATAFYTTLAKASTHLCMFVWTFAVN